MCKPLLTRKQLESITSEEEFIEKVRPNTWVKKTKAELQAELNEIQKFHGIK
jgi:hypothetical protein